MKAHRCWVMKHPLAPVGPVRYVEFRMLTPSSVRRALRECLQRQEQIRWQETPTAMESVVQGKVVSGAAVHTWLQSWRP